MTDNSYERVSPTLLALLAPIVAALDVAETASLAPGGLLQPYADVDERADGLLRAAREITTILRSRAS